MIPLFRVIITILLLMWVSNEASGAVWCTLTFIFISQEVNTYFMHKYQGRGR